MDQRRLRDLKWFKRIVGAKVWRVIVKLPVEWRHHFLAIYLSHHDRGFAQLLSSGRHFLAMLLAEHLCSAANDEIPAQELIRSCQNETRKKQREMAEMLQIPRRLLRGMTKVTPAGSNPSLLPAVAKAIEDPNMRKTWDHLPIIGPSTLSLIASESSLRVVRPEFLHYIVEFDRVSLHPYLAEPVENLSTLASAGFEIPRVSNLQQLWRTWKSFFAPYESDDVRFLLHASFPVPHEVREEPDTIEFIRTGLQLIRHANICRNCIASAEYVQQLRKGELHLLRVGGWGLKPATLQLHPLSSDSRVFPPYVITAIRGRDNFPVSGRTREHIESWAASQGIPIEGVASGRRPRQGLLPGYE